MQPPKRLKGDARRKWLEVFKDFLPTSPLDTEAASQYCEAWSDYLNARKVVADQGIVLTAGKNGAPYQHPAVGIQNKALDQMRRLYQRLSPLLTEANEDEEFEL